jgi:ribosomal protein L7/L12
MELFVLPIAISALVVVYVVVALSRIQARLEGSETKLLRLIHHFGIDPDLIAEPSEKVKALARMPGSKVAAIKAYRQETGLDLKEAKAVIDKLAE